MIHPLARHYAHDPAAARLRLLGALLAHTSAAGAAAALQVPRRTVERWIAAWGLAWAPLGRWHVRGEAAPAPAEEKKSPPQPKSSA